MWNVLKRRPHRDIFGLLGLQDVPLQDSAVTDEVGGATQDWEALRKQQHGQQEQQGRIF